MPDALHDLMDKVLTQDAAGVEVLVLDTDDALEVFGVRAQRQGSGDVGRWLDALPRGRRCIMWCVESDRMTGMLARRGFRQTTRWSPIIASFDELCWIREAGAL